MHRDFGLTPLFVETGRIASSWCWSPNRDRWLWGLSWTYLWR